MDGWNSGGDWWDSGYTPPALDFTAPSDMNFYPGEGTAGTGYLPSNYFVPGGVPSPTGAAQPAIPNWLGAILGMAGPALGLLGSLAQPTGTSNANHLAPAQSGLNTLAQGAIGAMTPAATDLWNQGTTSLSNLGAGTTPLQEQQAALLGQLPDLLKALTSSQSNLAAGGLSPAQQQVQAQALASLSQMMGGQNAMQQQQQQMLSALQSQQASLMGGSGGGGGVTGVDFKIPSQAELAALVKSAFEPYVGDIASQAIASARNRGFAGGAELLNTGPGGAIAGPALANAAGMEGQALLQAMLQFPAMASQIGLQSAQAQAALQQAAAQQLNAQGNLLGQGASIANAYNAPLSLMQALAGLGAVSLPNSAANIAGMQNTGAINALGAAGNAVGAFNQPLSLLDQVANQSLGPMQNQATGYSNLFAQYPGAPVPYGAQPNLGAQVGNIVAGGASGYALPDLLAQQQTQQTQQQNAMMELLKQMTSMTPTGAKETVQQSGGGLSGQG